MDGAKRFGRGIDGALDVGVARHIGLHEACAITEPLDQRATRHVVDIEDDDVAAILHHHFRGGAAKAGGPATDQHGLSVESHQSILVDCTD